jgi:Ca2+-transporting ATPase
MTISKAEESEMTPLEKKLNNIAKNLTYISFIGSILTLGVLLGYWFFEDVFQNKWNNSFLKELVEILLVVVTMFICAVPESLPLAVTLSLGFSMKRMIKDRNFVCCFSACETMGGVTSICSHKAGLLLKIEKLFQDFINIINFISIHLI